MHAPGMERAVAGCYLPRLALSHDIIVALVRVLLLEVVRLHNATALSIYRGMLERRSVGVSIFVLIHPKRTQFHISVVQNGISIRSVGTDDLGESMRVLFIFVLYGSFALFAPDRAS